MKVLNCKIYPPPKKNIMYKFQYIFQEKHDILNIMKEY